MSGAPTMTAEEIASLVHYAAAKGLSHFAYSVDGFALDFALGAGAAPVDTIPVSPERETGVAVKATVPGYVQYVRELQVAQYVSKGQIVAIIEADRARFPVVSSTAGCIASIELADHQLAGYGTPVLTIIPDEA